MKKIILLIISILFGLIFLNAGLNKFFHYMPMPDNLPEETMKAFIAMVTLKWLMPLIATAEITGGILFMIPRTRAFGAIVVFPVMIGICLHHMVIDPTGLPVALILLAIEIWVIIENRHKYFHMFS